VLLAFDYDGTLAPIVTDPAKAVMRPRTRALLDTLSERYPACHLRRSQADAKRLLHGIGLAEIIGNPRHRALEYLTTHGSQTNSWRPILESIRRVFRASTSRTRILVGRPLSTVAGQEKARAEIRRMATTLARAPDRRQAGRHILPPGRAAQGHGARAEREQLAATRVYVGDDTTDEDVFGSRPAGQLLSIRVGVKSSSAGPYYLRNQERSTASSDAPRPAQRAAAKELQ